MNEIYFEKQTTKGRPRFILNANGKEMVVKLAGMMCTDEEIASILNTSVDTLTNGNNKEAFTDNKEKGICQGKASLRKKQYEVAMKGDRGMLIWLGKQYLGQSEKISANVDNNSNAELMKEYLQSQKRG